MDSSTQPPESTTEKPLESIDELTVHRHSKWQDKDGRLLVVFGFWYGPDIAKPHAGLFQKTDIELLDVQAEQLNVLPYGRFLHYVIHGKLKRYHGSITTEQTPQF